MNPRGILTSRTWHLAHRLAIFAVLAQLALGIASAQHQARVLAGVMNTWAAICTPDGVQYINLDSPPGKTPAGEDSVRLIGGMECAVCAAALLLPVPAPAQKLAASMAATERLLPPKALAQPTATPDLLPPPRAPPHTVLTPRVASAVRSRS